jgi:phospholipid-binding lipoprotein MlaA
MKLRRSLLLIVVLTLCSAALWADTLSTPPDTAQSSMAPRILADANSDAKDVAQKQPGVAPPGQETAIVLTQSNEAEPRKARGAAPAKSKNVTEEVEEETPRIRDPLAPFNKAMYHFNDKLYFWGLKPVTQVYSHAVPKDVRNVIGNFYDNLWAPSRVLNNLFQLRLKAAGKEFIRFLFNSVVGIGGLRDAAKPALGIKKQEADFGQTLGYYGMGHGFFLVLPVFGPSSLRDGIGLAGDQFMHPLTYVSSRYLTFWQKAGLAVHEKVNTASFKRGDYESFKESAIDPYVSMRDAFVQYRLKVVKDSKK